MTPPHIPGDSYKEEFAHLWAVLYKTVEANAKNAELLTKLGCTVEHLIEMQAGGTPRCTNHTDRLLAAEKEIALLTSGEHPQWTTQAATLKNWVMVGTGTGLIALVTTLGTLIGAIK